MNNEPIEGMVPTHDGRFAVMIDPKNGHYGWVFIKHPDGMWVSSRKASPAELSAAKNHYNSVAGLLKLFGGEPACTGTRPITTLEVVPDSVAAPVVPTGWKLVPIQPTPEMLKAVDDEADDKHLARGRAISAWSQMLDATPEPSVADIEPFAVIGDYAACGGDRTVFTPEYAELITDRMCSKTAVYTLGAVGAAVAAIKTLNAKGYTYHGAALWKPPVGEAPDFDLIDSMRADRDRLVRELDVLLNGDAGAAEQASLCDIVAQVRMELAGGAPLKRYVRAPSRQDPKYHEEWPEIEGGKVFDGGAYCRDLFEALKRYNVIVAETMPEGAVDE
ncbi:hypothetical protein KVG88_30155 [Pseudomonas sp. SWRI74]|uniref:Uncharacterized protein n=1 Tax=Pseudomonas azerbaijanoccidentalis TaxID=2842347 RepID=A0ABS6QZN3_9PSED|nr:hypothetical protein [Pseudomonas azerbaijanoccidentalis]MBV4524339.1 hypothetical protein [Pseudomonas azerbaijanoccidentalis]